MILRKLSTRTFGNYWSVLLSGSDSAWQALPLVEPKKMKELCRHGPWAGLMRVSAKSVDQNRINGLKFQEAIAEARKCAEHIQVLYAGHYQYSVQYSSQWVLRY